MKIKYVYKSETEIQDAIPHVAKANKRKVPVGKAHFFALKIDGDLQDRSLCGLGLSDIAEKTLVRDARIDELPVCSDCAEAWKNNPQSEWKNWKKSVEVFS